MLQKIVLFFVNAQKSVTSFLVSHPAVKALLNGLANAALGGAVAYLGPQISDLLNGGHTMSLSITWGGLYFAVSKSVAAWIQMNHDLIMGDIQNGLNQLNQAGGDGSGNGAGPVPSNPPQASRPILKAGFKGYEIKGKSILRLDPPKQN